MDWFSLVTVSYKSKTGNSPNKFYLYRKAKNLYKLVAQNSEKPGFSRNNKLNAYKMKVVLNQTVRNLGRRGEIVEVKPGYARNFLFPNELADPGTPGRLKMAEQRLEKAVMRKEDLVKNAKDIAGKVAGMKVVIKAKANEKGHLYAGVTEDDIIEEVIKAKSVELDKEFLEMDHFKEVGEYQVGVKIGDQSEEITVVVEAK